MVEHGFDSCGIVQLGASACAQRQPCAQQVREGDEPAAVISALRRLLRMRARALRRTLGGLTYNSVNPC
jgi:hypothetical protein